MRAVTSGTAAFALGVAKKDLDNILSRYPVRGFDRGRQGAPRRLSFASIEQVALAMDLTRVYSIPTPTALLLAEEALSTPEGVIRSPEGHLAIHVDVERIQRDLHTKLTDAIEYVIPPRLGRPPVRD